MSRNDLRVIVLGAMAVWVVVVGVVLLTLLERTPARVAAAIAPGPHTAPLVQSTAPIEVVIDPGTSADEIARLLVQRGVLADASRMSTLLALTGVGASLQAGRYELPANTPATELLRRLQLGLTAPVLVAVPEGLRLEEVGAIFIDRGFFTRAQWEAALVAPHDEPFLDLRPEGASLIGFLLPASYPIESPTTAERVVQAMLDHFDAEVTPAIREAAGARGLTLHELITLASIVEREAAIADDQPLIASAFLNRLALGMPLQADATVQFAVAPPGDEPELHGWWKRELTFDDLVFDSPYNTYVYPGLPPGPIANPGIDAIRAVADAPETDFYYFVAAPECDGSHRFTATLAEHEANVDAYNAAHCAP
jgi:UPF0755 protein